ncbi:hypothetical protein CCHR01_11269 [Colletotrichum chrysophilum]|uniref:Uncharacterized protein n=1 Tax=Colletotrichum chrysophilum TaxID=1836956 RepID=A0AAD9AIC7_9PEZI|nr:hypothetical protein CCHR01_11269 [Colletotrichum chrysophilum]
MPPMYLSPFQPQESTCYQTAVQTHVQAVGVLSRPLTCSSSCCMPVASSLAVPDGNGSRRPFLDVSVAT